MYITIEVIIYIITEVIMCKTLEKLLSVDYYVDYNKMCIISLYASLNRCHYESHNKSLCVERYVGYNVSRRSYVIMYIIVIM